MFATRKQEKQWKLIGLTFVCLLDELTPAIYLAEFVVMGVYNDLKMSLCGRFKLAQRPKQNHRINTFEQTRNFTYIRIE